MRTRVVVAALLAVGGCKHLVPDSDSYAVIVNSDAASRAALQQSVNKIFDTNVLLADDALTQSSLLIIERKMPRSIEGSPAQGRTMEMPYQLRLVTDGSNCILIDQRDASRHPLPDTRCVAEE